MFSVSAFTSIHEDLVWQKGYNLREIEGRKELILAVKNPSKSPALYSLTLFGATQSSCGDSWC